MTVYLLSVHGDADAEAPAPEVMQAMFDGVAAFNEEMMAAGVWVFAAGLEPADTATVVSAEKGDVVTTDGPYLETKEHIGGFWIISVPDLDAALSWAAKGSAACQGPVEVRPMQADSVDHTGPVTS